MADKKFTWADLKEVINNMPPDLLNKPITIWTEDEDHGFGVSGAKVLEENYRYDGDEACCPESTMKEVYDDYEENIDEYYIVLPIGMPILIIPPIGE